MSCPDCFTGHVHEGTPKGQVRTIHGLQTYVAGPASGDAVRGIVVIIPDAFGWEFVNNRLLADAYAEKGKYQVYLPDFMRGNAFPAWALDTIRSATKLNTIWDLLAKPYQIACLIYSMTPFVYYNRIGKSWPIVESFFISLRRNEGAQLPIGAAGFCWGGKHTLTLASGTEVNGKTLINAGFTGHPSLLKIPEDIEKITIPVSFALGELDRALPLPQIEQVQKAMEGKEGEVKVYYGAGHGFCVRADIQVDNVERQAVESEEQALDFFNRQFAKVSFE